MHALLASTLQGTLILGDMVMITATEVSSERIPYDDLPMCLGTTSHTGHSCLSWA